MKLNVTQLMIGTLGVMALATGIAMAGDEGEELTDEQKNLMLQLDANQDGVISITEAQNFPKLTERFAELDQNRDRVLEKAEFARFEIPDEPQQ